MISSSVFEGATDSMAAAERADLVEALLRGELAREEFDYLIKKIKFCKDGKRIENPPADGRGHC